MKKLLFFIAISLSIISCTNYFSEEYYDECFDCLSFYSDSGEELTISISNKKKNWDGKLFYSTDRKHWKEWFGEKIEGKCIYLRGTNNTYMNKVSSQYVLATTKYDCSELPPFDIEVGTMSFSSRTSNRSYVYCEGNIETLLDYKTVQRGEHPKMADYCFYRFFEKTPLITSPELPAEDLSKGCYCLMFLYSDLIIPPELPARKLEEACYQDMFRVCLHLSYLPELPSTQLAPYCYCGMFFSCLIISPNLPSLPATVLPHHCYSSMFDLNSVYLVAEENLSKVDLSRFNIKLWSLPKCSFLGTKSTEVMFLNYDSSYCEEEPVPGKQYYIISHKY